MMDRGREKTSSVPGNHHPDMSLPLCNPPVCPLSKYWGSVVRFPFEFLGYSMFNSCVMGFSL